MKVIHTSDWHLGRTLCGRKRHQEHEAFLRWLVNQIVELEVDAVLIAGDIFDNGSPDNIAQGLYYRFLFDVAHTPCRHVVVIGGNHDSPLFLEAPRELLRMLNVHIVGQISDRFEDEVIPLKNSDGEIAAVVCAVPFLRDRDIRQIEAGENMQDKHRKLLAGIQNHYQAVWELARNTRGADEQIPIIAMGHLFTQGGQTAEDDGVRDLYVGSLAHIPAEAFPKAIDYFALGHLHMPQRIRERIVYSGSPIPMGFQEAGQTKKIMLITFSGQTTDIDEMDIPSFERMETIEGDLTDILDQLGHLNADEQLVKVEIRYNGQQPAAGLREKIEDATRDTLIDVCRIRNLQLQNQMIDFDDNDDLSEMDESEVFERCMDQYEVPADDRADLRASYQEILNSLLLHDSNTAGGVNP